MDEMKNTQSKPGSDEQSVMRSYTYGIVVALLVTVSFVAGVFVADLSPANGIVTGEPRFVGAGAAAPADVDVEFAQFWEVWNMVKERYVEGETDDLSLFYGAIAGMVDSLEDPYSVYFNPEFAAEFAAELEGSFEGIGAEIGIKNEQLQVIAPLTGMPAQQAGLRSGDLILQIDGVETYGMFIEEAVRRIRGEKGTEVVLTIYREGGDQPEEIAITRDTIVVESLKTAIEEFEGKRYGVITLTHFNDQASRKFDSVVRDMLLENVEGVVLDLRNNPGGYLDMAVQVAGEWVPRSVIVREKFNDAVSQNHTSGGTARFEDMPTVVLVNGGSASASEIVSGALQDYEKAYVIGEVTYGKGSVQDYVEFADGSALKLTIAKWLTPNGRSISKEGIAPDETVEFTAEHWDNDLDPQLDRAFEVLAHPDTKVDPEAIVDDTVALEE